MSKFCQNCGSVMDDQQVVCAVCGTQNEAAPAAAKGFDKSKLPVLIGVGAGAVAVIVVLIILLTSIFGSGWKSAFNNYVDVTIKGKFDKVEKLAPKEYWEYVEDEHDKDIDDIKDAMEESWDDTMDYLEDEYGDNISVSFKAEKEKKLKDKKVEKIAEALEDEFDIDEKSVTEVIEVKGEMTIKGSDDDDDEDAEFTFAKIDGTWYMISYYEYDDEYHVSFSGVGF